jgi:hypothetical protein
MSDDEKWSVEFRLTRFDIRRYVMVKQGQAGDAKRGPRKFFSG